MTEHELDCRPVTLEGLLQLREQYPEGKIVVGNTEIGIEMKYGRKTYPIFIAATHVPELNILEVSDLRWDRVSLDRAFPLAEGT